MKLPKIVTAIFKDGEIIYERPTEPGFLELVDEIGLREATMDSRLVGNPDLDSMDLLEMRLEMEDEYDIRITDEQMQGLETVRKAYDLVTRLYDSK